MNISKAFIFSVTMAAVLSVGATVACAQDASEPSVADAARKARAEKKTDQPKQAKVLTNEDLSSLKGVISVVGPASESPAAAPAATETTAKAGPGETKGEAYFRKKFAEARRSLADDSKELDVLQREFGLKQTQYYSDPNVAMREQYDRSDLNKTQADIDLKKADVAKDQQAISDLDDELRKSGGDPGWGNAPDVSTSAANSPDTDAPAASAPESNSPPAPAPASTSQPSAPSDNTPKDSAPQ